ncbi:MAG: hypothetical protein H3C50_09170 [Kiritimatiellae bacterium]|nr:hypothetical protein [Kiritimatiellia bacterium]MCO5060616.1 class I SAM-dependent methyltransferase [Kiritimatiellia bacterium]MCO5068194.1 class I SAM-dependent methyltransferase [Kiritimatiellia bacterium]
MTNSIERHYQQLVKEFGDTAKAAQYSSRESQFRRFAALARIADLKGKRILDFGCGTASLFEYLDSVGQAPAFYCGVDIVRDFFPHARIKVPKGHFCHPDELGEMRFDYAFVSGVFNNRRRGNRKFWRESVKSLYSRCDVGVAFNMMSTYVDYRDPKLFYEHPMSAFDFVKRNVTPYVTLYNDYLPKEGSVPFEFVIFAYRKPAELSGVACALQ